eukprot:evm.model.scf_377EXC.1 EVM.evm.TU.scf_377EXC.1   scf_377EXC:5393-12910(+)
MRATDARSLWGKSGTDIALLYGRSVLRRTQCHSSRPPTVCMLGFNNGNGAVPKQPYNVVVTGSTKGIGLCLAKQFLEAGDRVVISSRTSEDVDTVCSDLSSAYGADNVKGLQCNVSKAKDVAELADFAAGELGSVDVWINNAGTNAYTFKYLMDSDEDDLIDIVQTNLLGVMLGCREAIRVMRSQPTDGHIFNMDGAGANGRPTPRFAAYGATKHSLPQLNKSIVAELQANDVTNVGVHMLSPGMCTTELLMSGADTPQAKFFINCLGTGDAVLLQAWNIFLLSGTIAKSFDLTQLVQTGSQNA